MKLLSKILMVFFLILLPSITFGDILSETPLNDGGLDMYLKIDKGYNENKGKYIERELKGGDYSKGDIGKELNKISENNLLDSCFRSGITPQDIETVAKRGENSAKKLQEITKDCADPKTGQVSQSNMGKFYNIVNNHYNTSIDKGKTKLDATYNIGKIAMYTDGSLENSPFDIMSDLDDINDIIFEDNKRFEGVNNDKLGKQINDLFNGNNTNQNKDNNNNNDKEKNNKGGDKKPNNSENNNEGNKNNSGELSKDDLCLNDNGTSLSKKVAQDLLKENNRIKKNNNRKYKNDLDKINNINYIRGENERNYNSDKKDYISDYKKVNDKKVWPCGDFFCIKISFLRRNYGLFNDGLSYKPSIEELLKRSNQHVKKFTNTSLIQSKMTKNNFEIGLRDLNLPDIFHVGINVTHKPVPLLNLDEEKKDGKKEYDSLTVDNLLERNYKSKGLDYKRQNDLNNFESVEAEKQSILNSTEKPYGFAKNQLDEYYEILSKNAKEGEYLTNTLIDERISTNEIDKFEKKLIELESFSRAMLEYTTNNRSIVKNMNDIPQTGSV